MENLAAWLLERGVDDSPVLTTIERTYTRGELRQRVREVASAVLDHARAREPAIVAIVGDTSFDLIAAHLGVLHAGAVSMLLPPLSPEHLSHVLSETQPMLMFAERGKQAQLSAVATCRILALDEVLPASSTAPRTISPSQLSVLLHTSGSTSRPKGVMLSARNIQHNTQAISDTIGLGEGDRALSFMPLHYAFGLSVLHTHLRAGASLRFGTGAFPSQMLSELQTSGATGLPGVPTLFTTLLNRTNLAATQLPQLRYAMISGGQLATPLVHRLREALPQAQVFLRYGVTEVTSGASALPPERADKIPSIGRGFAGAPLQVLRADGSPVVPGSGEPGEIVVRSDSVALGYWGEGEESQHFRNGAFHTGDIATVDEEGFVFVVGRERDFIKTAGFRVAPGEIEDVVARLPFVEEVAVCGVPHPILGESLLCCVIARNAAADLVLQVRKHCAAQLPSHKVPTQFELVASLPRTSNGKLDRRRLRELFQGNAARPKADSA
jgi:acyl-CoA synthetase (AMP-forming)/AMP-acid ligase II